MKYKNYMSVLLFTGVIGLQSCESFLDTYPKESYGDNTVWTLSMRLLSVIMAMPVILT